MEELVFPPLSSIMFFISSLLYFSKTPEITKTRFDRIKELLLNLSFIRFKPESLNRSISFILSSFLKKVVILAAVLSPISSIFDRDSKSKAINSSIDFICFKIVLEADSPTYLIPIPYNISEMILTLILQFLF